MMRHALNAGVVGALAVSMVCVFAGSERASAASVPCPSAAPWSQTSAFVQGLVDGATERISLTCTRENCDLSSSLRV